jgi:hypothetical protein
MERTIDDFFTVNGIEHEPEPNWPVHVEHNPNGRKRADWKLADGTMVEAAGLLSDVGYAARIEIKRQLARELAIPLIVLEPIELSPPMLGQLNEHPQWTWEFQDAYGGARTVNERYFALAKRESIGNLRPGQYELTGFARMGWLTLLCILATNEHNRYIVEWNETREARRRGWAGRVARKTRAHLRRELRLAALRTIHGVPARLLKRS